MNTLAKHELKEIQPGVTVALHHCSSELVGVAGYNGSRRLVAFQAIAAGTMIFRIEGRETRRPTRFSIQIAEDRHVDSAIEDSEAEILHHYFWRFLNHSCNPNVVIRDRMAVATRRIEPWEDVTFNYNTTEFEMAEPFECQCGQVQCLRIIRGFKHLDPQEQERLRPLLAPYLRRLLRPR